jgi:hypothetical protein
VAFVRIDVRSTLGLPLSVAALLGMGVSSSGCNNGGGADGDASATDTDPGGTADDGDGSGDDTGGTADETGDTGMTELPDDIEPVPGGLRRMLTHEFSRSVELLLGPEAALAAVPPADVPDQGWDAVGNTVRSIDSASVELFEATATAIADAVVANKSTLAGHVPCVVDSPDAACFETLARDLGHLAYRRPLTDDEVASLTAIGNEGAAWEEGTGFDSGLKYELMAMLQAPSFIYISEVGEEDESGFRRLTGGEMASRMSFFLLGHTPDLALLTAGENGELETEEQIRAAADAMIASDEARVAVFSFWDELHRLRYVAQTAEQKDPEVYPLLTPALAEAMRQESLLVLHDIVWQNDGDWRDLFTAGFTYVNDDLAALYGMPAPGVGGNFIKVDWPAEQGRAGILSQSAFLTVHSHHIMNSPSKRGKYVQQALLCNPIPPPPEDVEAVLPEPVEGQTLREALIQHKEDPACASCHTPMDEVGFAFEFFDAVGQYRTLDNGSPIVASGEIEGVGTWADAVELGEVLKNDPRTTQCLINNLLRGELGQIETPGIEPEIENLLVDFEENGFSMKSLMVEMTASPIFRYVDEPK